MIDVSKRKEVYLMEETLGKRIVYHRKRLSMTQDTLATALGVTAQAVSKWENDQSCPDITTLPKLAELFGITTDELLGLPPKQVHVAEVVTEQDSAEPEKLHIQNGPWEFQWDGGRKSSLGLAVWVLLVGVLAMANAFGVFGGNGPSLRTLGWTCGLLLFGLFGLVPKFRFFRLGCALTGGYFLLNELGIITVYPEWKFIFPGFLVLLGLSLFFDALRKPSQDRFRITRCGRTVSAVNACTYHGDRFSCATSFGTNTYPISLSRISGGEAELSFGEMTVDLSGCEEITPNCRITLDCAFGQLTVLLPRNFRAELNNDTAFGSVEVQERPDSDALPILLDCNISFGTITLRYI